MAEFAASTGSGYAIGRIGHVLVGDLPSAPHHWIWGLLLIAAGAALRNPVLAGVGTGLWISDGLDYLSGRLIGNSPADEAPVRRLIGID